MDGIHPTAVIDPGAKLGDGVELGPYTVVGDGVELAAGVHVGSHVIVVGRTTIGARSRIFPFSDKEDMVTNLQVLLLGHLVDN